MAKENRDAQPIPTPNRNPPRMGINDSAFLGHDLDKSAWSGRTLFQWVLTQHHRSKLEPDEKVLELICVPISPTIPLLSQRQDLGPSTG